ncbi:MAG TPA: glycosyltransferase family 4 protein [Mucilaginibacter sp.]|jgi:UDP-N-acetylmuramyl pentapeptide phosphotransferase/UDP-N-acetylglucosamine-1-phosphate transferase
MAYLILVLIFFVLIVAYFSVAIRYNIIDRPNERSSHDKITIRGGGVIFLLAAICMVIVHPEYWLPVFGILIIGAISFLDDVLTLSSQLRLLFHLIAVTIMFFYLKIFYLEPLDICGLLYIMVIGVINVYNFMDGINGITGAYSLVVLAGLQYANIYQVEFIDIDMIWIPMLACGVFLYFNFRKKAKCFAGDVGSVTIAFWISLLLLKLIFVTGNWSYILFLAVYGVDSVLTIVHRLILKQNIFKAHRLHFYQLLANERKVPHLFVSAGYGVVQLVIILFVVFNTKLSMAGLFSISLIPLLFIYLLVKPRLMKLSISTHKKTLSDI